MNIVHLYLAYLGRKSSAFNSSWSGQRKEMLLILYSITRRLCFIVTEVADVMEQNSSASELVSMLKAHEDKS